MGMAKMPPMMMKSAMPISLSPTLPRKRGQTNRFASFMLYAFMRRDDG